MACILVTGASSNLGQHIVPALRSAGFSAVRMVCRSGEEDDSIRWNMSEPLPPEVADRQWDGIIHLASTGAEDNHTILTHDIAGMDRLMTLWRGTPFIYCSSQTVYGIPRGVLDEDHPLEAVMPYDWGKLSNEFRLRQESHAHDPFWPGVSLRLGLLFGPYTPGKSGQFLDWLTDAILSGRRLVFPTESARHVAGSSFIGGADAGQGFVKALSLAEPARLNIAGPFCRWSDLIDAIAGRLGLSPNIEVVPPGDQLATDFVFPGSVSRIDSGRFEGLTGWQAKQTLDACVDAYLSSLY